MARTEVGRRTAQPAGAPPLVRVDLEVEALGFKRPPAPVQMRFLRGAAAWTLLAVFPAGAAQEVATWIRGHVQAPPTLAPGVAPRMLRCQLDHVPPTWMRWLESAPILQIDLMRHGTATLFVRGTPAQVSALTLALGARGATCKRVLATTDPHEMPLTGRQLEALCNAVALGYYDVPHRIDLRRLGRTMGLSASSVSQLLRRAQAHVIRSFVDAERLERGRRLQDAEPAVACGDGASDAAHRPR